jgi:hypothetical protein
VFQGAIGLELWSMSDGIIFDNFFITDNKKVADDFAKDSWAIKYTEEEAQRSSVSMLYQNTPLSRLFHVKKFQMFSCQEVPNVTQIDS